MVNKFITGKEVALTTSSEMSVPFHLFWTHLSWLLCAKIDVVGFGAPFSSKQYSKQMWNRRAVTWSLASRQKKRTNPEIESQIWQENFKPADQIFVSILWRVSCGTSSSLFSSEWTLSKQTDQGFSCRRIISISPPLGSFSQSKYPYP